MHDSLTHSSARFGSRAVVTIDELATVGQAARLMRDRHVGALVRIAGNGARVAGVVTDRDLVLHALAEGMGADTPLSSLATGRIVAVDEAASFDEIATAMAEAGVRRVLLLDQARRLAGIVTLDDLLARHASQTGMLAAALQRGIGQEAASLESAPASVALQVPDDVVHGRQ